MQGVTGLRDTPENRRRCEHTMRQVDAAIRRDDFDYRTYFPRGSRLHLFCSDTQPDGLMTFQEYMLRWHRLRSPFRPDGTVAKDADLHPSTWLQAMRRRRNSFTLATSTSRKESEPKAGTR